VPERPSPPHARPPLHRRALDGDELVGLEVLKAATETNAPAYAAILSVLVTAKERYEVQVRTELVAEELARLGHDPGQVVGLLEQLRTWGNVTSQWDTSRVRRLEDFRRRRELWQLTAAGHAAHDAIVAVLGAAEQAGSLQRALFRDIRENLTALAEAMDEQDATAVYLRLRDLDGALRDLAANARDFHATIGALRREHEVDPARFLAYKSLLIDYLQEFLDDLLRYRVLIAAQVAGVEARGVDRLAKLAAEGDDSRNIFTDDDLAARWEGRWRGLAAWFVPPPGDRTGAERLSDATIAAIRDLMALLRRLTESATRPITRASELLHLARWFCRLETENQAHELFDAAFGMGRTQHFSLTASDPEAVGPTTSWWEAPPVDVPMTLRRYGRRPPPGPPQRVTDFSATKQRLAAEHAAARAGRAEAAARLSARPLAGRVLSGDELDLLLELLDRAAHRRPLSGPFRCEVTAEGVRLVLCEAPGPTAVTSVRGMLTLERAGITIERVTPAGPGG
jgi:uncharacterized protein (TIGR02677 family)